MPHTPKVVTGELRENGSVWVLLDTGAVWVFEAQSWRQHRAAIPPAARETKHLRTLRGGIESLVEEFKAQVRGRLEGLDVSERDRHSDLRQSLAFADDLLKIVKASREET